MALFRGHATWSNRTLVSGAAIFVAVYALAAAWVVVAETTGPEPLGLHQTADGDGVVITGAVVDTDDRDALIAAIGDATGVSLIVTELEIDPKADPIFHPERTASALAEKLPPDRS